MTPLFKKFLGMNWLLVLNIAGLIVFGVYAIFNASAHKEDMEFAFKWRDQIRWVMLGLPFFFAAVIIAHQLQARQTVVDILAFLFVVLRIAF